MNNKIEQQIATVLRARQKTSNLTNVVEVLQLQPAEFQLAFDIALEMENRNLVKLLYSNFNAAKVVVEFTLLADSYEPK